MKLGSHGFPEVIASIEDLITIARDIGQELYTKQADIIAVGKGEKQRTGEVWVERKPDGSTVTSSDIWANGELATRLCALVPDRAVGFIAEESDKGDNRAAMKKSACFVIDPLDNTGSYKRGEPDWSVTIGFAVEGKPTGGVVYYPAQGRLFFTGDDGNSYLLQDQTGVLTKLIGPAPKTSADTVQIMTDSGIAPVAVRTKVRERHGVHTERYWDIALLSANTDIAEHGDLFYAWDVVAPAAITARAGTIYLNRDGTPLDFLAKREGYNDFELPREGFIAGQEQTLRNFGILNPGLNASSPIRPTDRTLKPS